MGKFLKYESSNYRTFAIDTTASKIKRPERSSCSDLHEGYRRLHDR